MAPEFEGIMIFKKKPSYQKSSYQSPTESKSKKPKRESPQIFECKLCVVMHI